MTIRQRYILTKIKFPAIVSPTKYIVECFTKLVSVTPCLLFHWHACIYGVAWSMDQPDGPNAAAPHNFFLHRLFRARCVHDGCKKPPHMRRNCGHWIPFLPKYHSAACPHPVPTCSSIPWCTRPPSPPLSGAFNFPSPDDALTRVADSRHSPDS